MDSVGSDSALNNGMASGKTRALCERYIHELSVRGGRGLQSLCEKYPDAQILLVLVVVLSSKSPAKSRRRTRTRRRTNRNEGFFT